MKLKSRPPFSRENNDFVFTPANDIEQAALDYVTGIQLSWAQAHLLAAEIYIKQNKINKAVRLIQNNYNKFKATPYYHNMIFRLGDLYALNFDYDSASRWYNKIVENNPNHQLHYLSKTRLSLIEHNKLREYLDGNDSLKLQILISINNKTFFGEV